MIKDFSYAPRKVDWLTDEEEKLIKATLKGFVYDRCQQKGDEWFTLSTLVGSDDENWTNTKLILLFDHHKSMTGDDALAHTRAGWDAGKLLMETLYEDKRWFEYRKVASKGNEVSQYRWIKEKENTL